MDPCSESVIMMSFMITVGCQGGTYDQKPFAHPGSKQLQTSVTSCLYAPASCLFLLQHDVKFSPVRSREEFALSRLKKELSEDGVFHLRWSALDSRRILLTVMNSSQVGHAEDSMAVVQDTVDTMHPIHTVHLQSI